VQRAIMRPARETLFTVVSREDKYKSKAFIDTFVYRGGDVVGAQTEGLLGRLGMGLAALASVAVPLALVWAALGIWLGRAQQRPARRCARAARTLGTGEFPMITRREWLGCRSPPAPRWRFRPRLLMAQKLAQALITRAIPSSGERLPVVGLGSSATFAQVARSEDVDGAARGAAGDARARRHACSTPPRLRRLRGGGRRHRAGARLTDTLFWATKLNVAGRGGGRADLAAARAQVEASFERIGKPDRPDPGPQPRRHPTTSSDPAEYKEAGRIRYVGVTTTFEAQYAELESIMRNEPLDFIGIDYAIDNRTMEETILPLARSAASRCWCMRRSAARGCGTACAARRCRTGREEFDAHSWAQFFLKFVIAHPAVTAATPATSRARHMIDNMGGARGRLPDAARRCSISARVSS
jgi:hypothetical protein